MKTLKVGACRAMPMGLPVFSVLRQLPSPAELFSTTLAAGAMEDFSAFSPIGRPTCEQSTIATLSELQLTHALILSSCCWCFTSCHGIIFGHVPDEGPDTGRVAPHVVVPARNFTKVGSSMLHGDTLRSEVCCELLLSRRDTT